MSKPTNLRLDQATIDRARAVQAASAVPVTLSAVLQEAIRRGLAEIEVGGFRDRVRDVLVPMLGERYARAAMGNAEEVLCKK